MEKRYDYIVIGSGAGGAPVAFVLAKKGFNVLILEAGIDIPKAHLGKFWGNIVYPGHYRRMALLNMSKEMTTIYQTQNVGGTTRYACGNIVRSLQSEFSDMGIDLERWYQIAEKHLNVTLIPKKRIVGGTKEIMEASKRLGIEMGPMPKGITDKKCNLCGDCVAGCATGHKWDARTYITAAVRYGATLCSSTKVKKVLLLPDGQAHGVQTNRGKFFADQVVVAAGGINTPVILLNSGIDAGNQMFLDPFNVTAGIVPKSSKLTQLKGESMGAVCTQFHDTDGFILSPFMDHWSQFLLLNSPVWNAVHRYPFSRTLSIMTKITDEMEGRVFPDGSFSKKITKQDKARLAAGANLSKRILREAGAKSIKVTRKHRGAHPGGTAAIGAVVDKNLSVFGTKGLHVCDASVIPITPGLPPILLITALGLRLGVKLSS